MSFKPRPRYVVLACPVDPPSWWLRRPGGTNPAWVTVRRLKNGAGWTLDFDKEQAMPTREINDTIEDFEDAMADVDTAFGFAEILVTPYAR